MTSLFIWRKNQPSQCKIWRKNKPWIAQRVGIGFKLRGRTANWEQAIWGLTELKETGRRRQQWWWITKPRNGSEWRDKRRRYCHGDDVTLWLRGGFSGCRPGLHALISTVKEGRNGLSAGIPQVGASALFPRFNHLRPSRNGSTVSDMFCT